MLYTIIKRAALPAVLATAASSADAVELYGAVDNFISYAKVGSQSTFALQSGGTSTSRFGMKGSEDLGGGWRANFQLEAGFESNTGAMGSQGTLFNRESWVGLSHANYGALQMGRLYPAYLPLSADPFYGVGKLSPFASFFLLVNDLGAGARALPARQPNSVAYTTPSIGGATLKLLAAPSGDNNGPRWDALGAVAEYNGGSTSAALSYNSLWCSPSLTPKSCNITVRTDVAGASLSQVLGNVTLLGAYQFMRPNADNTYVAQAATVGFIAQVGKDFVRGSVAYRTVSGKQDQALGALIGYDYTLSKRTNLYARAGAIRNQGASKIYYLAAPISDAGESMPVVAAVGLRHKF
ncbi:porin [Trinickia sp. YCB016]